MKQTALWQTIDNTFLNARGNAHLLVCFLESETEKTHVTRNSRMYDAAPPFAERSSLLCSALAKRLTTLKISSGSVCSVFD